VFQSNLAFVGDSRPGPRSGSLNLNTGQLSTERLPANTLSSLDRPHTRATLILYPDGDAQITGAHFYPATGKPNTPTTPEEKQKRAAGRAAGQVHAMAKFHALDHLWTITKRGGISTFEEATKITAKFKRLASKEFPGFIALFVPELHTGGGVNDGSWHIHFAVHGFYEVKVMRSLVYRVLGFDDDQKPRGQINVSSAHVGAGSHASVASYITAYISKNIFNGTRKKNQRYYLLTRSCALPNLKRPHNRALKFGIQTLGRDYRGRTESREARLLGEIFLKTGRFARIVWKSPDGLNFRMATFGRSYVLNQVSRQL
jgi:hypothetical protein